MLWVVYLRNLCQLQGRKDLVLCFLPEVLQLKVSLLDSDPY